MVEPNKYYYFFDFVIKSEVPLPELLESPPVTPLYSFSLSTFQLKKEPQWLHHWYLPNGEISISSTKDDGKHILRFPHLADFTHKKSTSHIVCHSHPGIPEETLRHLLLDQVLPRIVSQSGRQAIHASGVQIDDFALLFLGETGWGKSTMGAYFNQKGHVLLSDDCLLLERRHDTVYTLPSYASMRLLPDSYSSLNLGSSKEQPSSRVAHYSTKQRIVNNEARKITQQTPVPLSTILILNDPNNAHPEENITISPLTGALAAIELVKHTFHLDITDTKFIGKQLITLTQLCNSPNLSLFTIEYPRDHNMLPQVYSHILSFLSPSTKSCDR